MNSFLLAVLLVSGLGLLAGIGLALANLLMAVKVNEKAEKIYKVLPGINCGACSFSGCMSYAEALSTGKVKITLCTVGGDETVKQISAILGVKPAAADKKIAHIFCQGNGGYTSKKYLYQGIKTCKAASVMYGGDGACRFGCIGLGDCIHACNYDALSLEDGVVVVNAKKCVACSLCINTCPKHIISLIPKKKTPLVLCSSTDKGVHTRKVCAAGCIGCKLCLKVCEYNAISMNGALAVIDRNKCYGCGKCAEICKSNCIVICN